MMKCQRYLQAHYHRCISQRRTKLVLEESDPQKRKKLSAQMTLKDTDVQ